jgi:hypothetical protein
MEENSHVKGLEPAIYIVTTACERVGIFLFVIF